MKTFFGFLAILWSNVTSAQLQLATQLMVSGLNRPVGIVSAGDSRLFIVLQIGQIVIYDGTKILPTPFLDIRSLITQGVSGESEQGLLGLVFHPHYNDNGFFFVYYTNTAGNITVTRYSVSSDPDRANASNATIVLTIAHPTNTNHNGGQMQFGPDGYLYLGTGDGGGAGDVPGNAQNRLVLLGKLLRIDVDTLPYHIPPSNPFVNTAFRGEIWAYGLRNPWRFTFDRITKDLWIADVGQNQWEEVDLQPATSIGGENYGWHNMEGFHCFPPSSTNCQDPSFTLPILEYGHDSGNCSITGGYRYRGARFPRMSGIYFYGDFCSGTIWGATQQSNGTWSSQKLLSTHLAVSTFGEDANGELYVADLNGAIYRLVDTLPPQPRRRAVGK